MIHVHLVTTSIHITECMLMWLLCLFNPCTQALPATLRLITHVCICNCSATIQSSNANHSVYTASAALLVTLLSMYNRPVMATNRVLEQVTCSKQETRVSTQNTEVHISCHSVSILCVCSVSRAINQLTCEHTATYIAY
jgi:hypothetical protein